MEYPKLVIGWQECISLPDIGVLAIRAKIDTGAKTSSIHAYNIKYSFENGEDFVSFEIHPVIRNNNISIKCKKKLIDMRTVKSSSGEKEKRPVVETTLDINGNKWKIQLNLTNRDYMGSRMLLGREALNKYILVNPGVKYIHGKLTNEEIIKKYQK